MRATLDENGKLSITPHTPTESYALKYWWKEYMKSQGTDGVPCEASLEVNFIKEEPKL